MHGDMDRLIQYIQKHFAFTEKEYPELKGASENQRLKFAVRHSGLHFAKTTGKIVSVSEDSDHGDPLDLEELRKNIPKAFINLYRLTELVGLKEADVIKAIEEKYKEKIN